MSSGINYRNYPEYVEHNASTVGRMLMDAKDFFDAFPEHPVFRCTAGSNRQYDVTRKGNTYKVMSAS